MLCKWMGEPPNRRNGVLLGGHGVTNAWACLLVGGTVWWRRQPMT